jgi:DNA-binding GntR family transcriptional regulator
MSLSVSLSPIAVNFTLKDHTYDLLRDAILKMNIYDPSVDLRLDERKLAEQLAISRTPIREALARLAQDGLVEIVPRKGVFVQRKSRDEILEMVVTWAAL